MALLKRAPSGPRRAVWDGRTIAEADSTVFVDGREYFDPETVDWSFLEPIDATSVCHWKGEASYFDLVDGSDRLGGAAFVYADAQPEAAHIEGRIAFWRGVEIVPAD